MRELPNENYPNKYDVGDTVHEPLLGWTGVVEACVWSHLDSEWLYFLTNGQGKHCATNWTIFQRDLL